MLLCLLWPLAYLVACGDLTPKNDPQAEAWSAQYDAGRAAFAQSRFAEAGAAFTAAITSPNTLPPTIPVTAMPPTDWHSSTSCREN